MAKRLKCELVKVRTADNVHLHGLVYEPPVLQGPSSREAPPIRLDAAIISHGLGGNFYGSKLNHYLGEKLLEFGLTVAHVNTRGHDEVNMSTRNGRAENMGAAFEIVDECRLDFAAWIEYLVHAGNQNILLLGHSLGAIKSIYAQALQPNEDVKAIVAISASRLSYQAFLAQESRDKFLRCHARAQEMVDQGRERELMKVDFPFPTHMSPATYQDKYGPEDRYNWLRFVRDIAIPTLLIFGEIELQENAAFIDIVSDLNKLDVPNDLVQLNTIERANHFYVGRQQQLAATVESWLVGRFG